MLIFAFAFHRLPGPAAIDWLLNAFLYYDIDKGANTLHNVTESQWTSEFKRVSSRKSDGTRSRNCIPQHRQSFKTFKKRTSI
jgi:hypothetical protein